MNVKAILPLCYFFVRNLFLIIFFCFLFFIIFNFSFTFFSNTKLFDEKDLQMYFFLYFSSVGMIKMHYKNNNTIGLIKNDNLDFFILISKILFNSILILVLFLIFMIFINYFWHLFFYDFNLKPSLDEKINFLFKLLPTIGFLMIIIKTSQGLKKTFIKFLKINQ